MVQGVPLASKKSIPWEKVITFENATLNAALDPAVIADNEVSTATHVSFENRVAERGKGRSLLTGCPLESGAVIDGVFRSWNKDGDKCLLIFTNGKVYYSTGSTPSEVSLPTLPDGATALTANVPYSCINDNDKTIITNGYDPPLEFDPASKTLKLFGLEPPRFYSKVAYFESDETWTQASATVAKDTVLFRSDERTGATKTSLKLTATAGNTAQGYTVFSPVKDFSKFPNGLSISDDDYFVIWVYHRKRDYISEITVDFWTDSSDYYRATIKSADLDPVNLRDNQWTAIAIKRKRLVDGKVGSPNWASIARIYVSLAAVTGTAIVNVDNCYWKNAQILAVRYKTIIENFETDTLDKWTTQTDVNLENDSTYVKEDTGSLKLVTSGATGTIGKAVSLDLTEYVDGITSQMSDEIHLWVYCPNTNYLTSITLTFTVSGAKIFSKAYTVAGGDFKASASGAWTELETMKKDFARTCTYTTGTHEPTVGQTLYGQTSGAVIVVVSVTNSGGWGGSGTGTLTFTVTSGTLQASEHLHESAGGAGNLVCVVNALGAVDADWASITAITIAVVRVGSDNVTCYFDDLCLQEASINKQLSTMEVGETDPWVFPATSSSGSAAFEDNDKYHIQGDYSIAITANSKSSFSASRTLTTPVDLTIFGTGETSGNDDIIGFWIFWTRLSTLRSIELRIDCNDDAGGDFTTDYFTYEITPYDLQVSLNALAEKVGALANKWTNLEIKKSAFTRVGTTAAKGWGTIKGYKFIVNSATTGTVGKTTCYFDDLHMRRRKGLTGIYQWCCVFVSSDGIKSAPSEWSTQLTVTGTRALLNLIPLSADSNCVYREIYRKGGALGADARKTVTIWDNTTTQYFDDISDTLSEDLLASEDIPTGTIRVPTVGRFCDTKFRNRIVGYRDPTNYRRLWFSNVSYTYAWSELQAIDFDTDIFAIWVMDDVLFVNCKSGMKKIVDDLGNLSPNNIQELGLIEPCVSPAGHTSVDEYYAYATFDGVCLYDGYTPICISDMGMGMGNVKNYFDSDSYQITKSIFFYRKKHLYISIINSGGTRYLLDFYLPAPSWRMT